MGAVDIDNIQEDLNEGSFYSSEEESRKIRSSGYTAQIKILSDADIMASSYGEVIESKTINYRTLKPEKDGLFCAKIFGPIRDYQCLCGKYDKIKYKGIICEKCGVEVTLSSVRRYRAGHIRLAVEVVNPLFLKGSKITDLLDITKTTLLKILSFDYYLVLDGGNTPLKRFQVLTKNEFEEAEEKYGSFSFKADYGAKAIDIALNSLDLKEEYDILNEKLKSGEVKSEIKLTSIRKRMKTIKDFYDSDTNPSSMILKSIMVMPPELRPLMQIEGKTIISDINNLYANLIDRNNRLKKLIELEAPEIIIQNEKRMVSEACNNLIIGSNVSPRADRPPLKSLTDSFKGKQGRFRQNLLGKRVDYSGRAVIVSGPTLKLNQCKIPKEMALELFRPFLISKLCLFGHASSMYSANILIDEKNVIVWDILEKLTNENCVLLNRAPTLHRLGIQGFEILLGDDEAIHLHPLTCKAFNADFDGDQMGVHLPLTLEAQIEARVLILSSNNIVNIANGEIIISPRKDIVLGLYYLTLDFADEASDIEMKSFYSYKDILYALEAKIINYNTKIKYYFKYHSSLKKDEREKFRSIITTPGRVEMFNLIPDDGQIKFEDWNVAFGIDQVNTITKLIYDIYGNQKTVEFCDQIMYFGFKFATLSSVSISALDLKVPNTKNKYISDSINELLKIEDQYKDGIITLKEKENKITDVWSKASSLISEDLKKEISKNDKNRDINSLSLMMKSGSRVSMIQLLQICGMKGLVTTASLGVIYTAVISSYIEGLNLIEFFISAYGARKGNVDSALKTPFTGYFARKLATVAQSCVIIKHNCGTKEGIKYKAKNFEFKKNETLADIAFGRVLAKDIIIDDKVIYKAGVLIDKDKYEKLKNFNLKEITLRSPVTCEEEFGICSQCYGYDIITNSLITFGAAVGIIAAQSIGEPGTQLTLKTFHSGGATSKISTDFDLISPIDGELFFNEEQFLNLDKCSIFVGYNLPIDIKGEGNKIHSYTLNHGAKVYFKSGDKIKAKTKIADWDPYNSYIFAEEDGIVKYEDLIRQLSYNEIFDDATGKSSKVIVNWLENAKNLRPNILIVDKKGNVVKSKEYEAKYYLSSGMILMKQDGDEVKKGDIIVRMPKEVTGFQKDITGGLPRVEELFEARIPDSCSVISPCNARIKLVDSSSSKNKIILNSVDDTKEYSFSVSKDKCILFKNGSLVQKGDIICDGNINPHDLLIAQGIDELTNYLLTEILKVYTLQGVVIQIKHVEIIIRYMLRKVEIISEGDCENEDVKIGSKHFVYYIKNINKKLINEGKQPVEYNLLLQGITKASLSTESFIEAATFQEPLKTLTEAACVAKIDPLIGIKENLVIGNLTPTGTGISVRQMCAKYGK